MREGTRLGLLPVIDTLIGRNYLHLQKLPGFATSDPVRQEKQVRKRGFTRLDRSSNMTLACVQAAGLVIVQMKVDDRTIPLPKRSVLRQGGGFGRLLAQPGAQQVPRCFAIAPLAQRSNPGLVYYPCRKGDPSSTLFGGVSLSKVPRQRKRKAHIYHRQDTELCASERLFTASDAGFVMSPTGLTDCWSAA